MAEKVAGKKRSHTSGCLCPQMYSESSGAITWMDEARATVRDVNTLRHKVKRDQGCSGRAPMPLGEASPNARFSQWKRFFLRPENKGHPRHTARPQTHVPDSARSECHDLLKPKRCPNPSCTCKRRWCTRPMALLAALNRRFKAAHHWFRTFAGTAGAAGKPPTEVSRREL